MERRGGGEPSTEAATVVVAAAIVRARMAGNALDVIVDIFQLMLGGIS